MPVIRFVKNIQEIQVEEGVILMEALLEAGLPVASSCHGDGVCAKCRVDVINGAENLSQIEPLEQTLIDRNRLPKTKRVSCQARVLGDVTIDTAYW